MKYCHASPNGEGRFLQQGWPAEIGHETVLRNYVMSGLGNSMAFNSRLYGHVSLQWRIKAVHLTCCEVCHPEVAEVVTDTVKARERGPIW